MHLYLVRHGECHSESSPGVFTPDGELSALGERQACLAAERLTAVSAGRRRVAQLERPLASAICRDRQHPRRTSKDSTRPPA